MTRAQLKVDMPSDGEIAKMFGTVPALERHRVHDRVLGAAAQPVVTRARQLAPRSSKTQTADKRSQSQRQQADWDFPLWKTIGKVVRKYAVRGMAVVGPKWPKGNKAFFNTSEQGRRQVLWGKPTGKVVRAVRNWIVQAYDETRTQQVSATKGKLRQVVDDLIRGR